MKIFRLASAWLGHRISTRILSVYLLILGGVLFMLLIAIGRLATYSNSVTQAIVRASPHIQSGSTIAQQIASVRLQIAQYLRTQSPGDYNAATQSVDQLGLSINRELAESGSLPVSTAVSQVQTSYQLYINAFRQLIDVTARRDQMFVQLLSTQTRLATMTAHLQEKALESTDTANVVLYSIQMLDHVQLASTEITTLRLQTRFDSVEWLTSELIQIQLWRDKIGSKTDHWHDGMQDIYQEMTALSNQYLEIAHEMLVLFTHEERDYRAVLNQMSDQLARHSDSVLNRTIDMLNTEMQEMIQSATTSQQLLVGLLIIVASVSILAAIVTTVNLTRPLGQLSTVAKSITAGNLGLRAHFARQDEIGQLATAFNQMTDSLYKSLETERAANEQIRLQAVQISRQMQTSAILQERQRIACELHDSVKQQLFSISLSAGAALNFWDSDPDAARCYVEHLKQASRDAQAEMKNLLQELAPAPLQEHRLQEALHQYLLQMCETHRLRLTWSTSGANELSVAQEHALFRAAQEALANVIRHSKANAVTVTLTFECRESPDLATLTVEDNGQGFSPDRDMPGSSGLALMRTRMARVNGEAEVRSILGRGTNVTLRIPSVAAQPLELVIEDYHEPARQ
ncbi:MAG: sensor histidine kinase [Anaerolineae bacterium]|nr:sensor histidine kinase [Anaerolineae bacterium]